ncbi:MAG TPA: sulfotransferase [Sphingomicrobium sp.]|jgi:tetratricopeptide (TPR) repeat protein|nr:sulfotransferase [Sphingomicrobium sp.]
MTVGGAAVGSMEQALANARLLLRSRDFDSAIQQTREILEVDDRCVEALRVLGMALRASGNNAEALDAEMAAIRESNHHPDVFQATLEIADNKLDEAEHLLRDYLKDQWDDAVALRLLADIGARLGRLDAAEHLLENALQVAPDYPAARSLLRRVREARANAAGKTTEFPRGLRAEGTDGAEQYAEALDLFEQAVERFPDSPRTWIGYGHILRTTGRREDAIAAYRHSIELKPDAGDAWWALADLKTVELGSGDIEQLSEILAAGNADAADVSQLHFALGRALEQAGRFEESFGHYAEGNQLIAACDPYDRTAVTRHVDESIRLLDGDFFRARENAGFDTSEPIFVLGMPRAGSTLIEQILASHSEVEGTMELPNVIGIANWLAGGKRAALEVSDYLATLAALPPSELLKLGKGYMWGTALRRQTDRPFFVDKMPNNWLHLGLILAILPKAKIIDARRHPMACGLSNFRQHFGAGQAFSYDLSTIGAFYADYVRMMDHFDRVLPGRVIRVIHEELTADPEAEIRSLLDRLRLPFDEACLNFHDNKRAVRTSSSEQVRRPISREGVEQWRAFEPWLGPLKRALGSIADSYPEVPNRV